jgi:predicted outer membrane repeat protein
VLVERSFFYLNSADSQGGAIAGWVLVVNSTFVGNSAEEGGAIYGEEDAKVLFSTIADNTARAGGSYGGVTGVTIKNSIVARNWASDDNDNCDPSDIVAEGVNLTDDESCPGFIQVETDQLGLADTPDPDGTLPLLSTSLALGAAVDCTDFSGALVTADQRRTSRPQGGACDAGAYELEGVSAPSLAASPGQVVDVGELDVFTEEATATFTVTYGGSDSVNITLAGPFNLGLDPQLVEQDTDCDGANLSENQSCTVKLTVSPTGLGRQGAAVRLEIANAEPFYLLVYATGTITRTFHVNTTDDIAEDESLLGDGRCDYDPDTPDDQCSLRAALDEADAWDGGTFIIRLQGGATYSPSTHLGKFDLWDYGSITIEGNGATIDGGIAPEDCTSPDWLSLLTLFGAGQLFKLQNVTIQHNCSSGPALRMEATGQLVLEGVTVQDNVGSGLGVWSNATVSISGSAFLRNKAVRDTWDGRYNKGGGVYIGNDPCCWGWVSPQVHIEHTRFEENEATLEGGALWVNISGGQVTVEHSLFVGNRTGANGEGGAIWVSLPASEGGSAAGSMVIRNSAILGNQAGSDGGGGIYVGGPCYSGTLKLVNVTIAGNTTTGTGGGIDTSRCDRVDLSFVTITANTASQGGGIYSGGNGDFKRLKGVVLVGNTATQGGPDCYGPITSSGGNVIGSTAGCTVTAQASDVTGVAATAVLAARDETTGTYPLAANSPAAGRVADCRDLDNTDIASDQRGQPRPNPSNSACDAGAYESDQAGGGGGGTGNGGGTGSGDGATGSGDGTGGGGTGGQAPPPPPPPEETVTSPTGSGQVTFQVVGGATPSNLDVAPFTGTPPVLPSSLYQLPHGVYSLRVEGLPRGASVTIQVRLPSPAPVGTVWLKLIGGRWVALPVGSDDGDNVITVTLTDGGQGDADGVVNGVITDPGGPAIPLRIAVLWGDVDCDGVAGVGDALKVLRHVVRLPVTARQPCPRIEERVLVAGALRAWGDVDGDGVVSAVDALKLLRHLVRLSVSRAAGTPSIGGEVEVSPPGE